MSIHMLLPACGGISLRFTVLKKNLGIFNIAFWASFFATILAFFYYSMHYWVDPRPPFFSPSYQLGIMRIAMIWIFRVIVDTFSFLTFIYFTSKKKIAKAACFVTLNGFFIIIFNILIGTYDYWIYGYLAFIYSGYLLIAYDRKRVAEKKNRGLIKIRFMSYIDQQHKEIKYSDFKFNPEMENKELEVAAKQASHHEKRLELSSLSRSVSAKNVDFRENYFDDAPTDRRTKVKTKVISKDQEECLHQTYQSLIKTRKSLASPPDS
uniref:Uncharacterized protein n=1 Tax=Euplotes crassus TaxID=5936 RepID=A0A7S3NZ62_EUPCR|mmetsp:Transcript_37098/g.36686  ORF Transcript_37098/g.36686 Transcript_37098/m.36686 type:complete len:265 (+) Transcript_37098:509-1303(+)